MSFRRTAGQDKGVVISREDSAEVLSGRSNRAKQHPREDGTALDADKRLFET